MVLSAWDSAVFSDTCNQRIRQDQSQTGNRVGWRAGLTRTLGKTLNTEGREAGAHQHVGQEQVLGVEGDVEQEPGGAGAEEDPEVAVAEDRRVRQVVVQRPPGHPARPGQHGAS